MATGADFFLDALATYGVERVFGNPGTTELPVVHGIEERDLDYTLALHEDPAVGMAAGYAAVRRYGEGNPLGVVNLHVAPGLAHGLGNLYGAAFAGAPLLVTAGNYATDFQHEEPILGGDLVDMAEPHVKWSAEVSHPDALPTMIRRAVRVALTPPTGPVFLSLPVDVMTAEVDADVEPLGDIPTAGEGDPQQIESAADALVDADAPVFVLGDEIARAGPEAVAATVRLAEETGATVFGEYIAAEVNFPTDHAQWQGGLGGDGDRVRERVDGDVLLLVGRSTDTTSLSYDGDRLPPEATKIHVGPDAWELGKNEVADHTVLGDPGLVLDRIADALSGRIPDGDRRRRLDRIDDDGGRPESDAEGPGIHVAELGRAMAEAASDARIINEGVTAGIAVRRVMRFEHGDYVSNKSGGLGYGLPAAIGAAFAHRDAGSDRPVVGFIGDGSYLYYPQTMYTPARYDLDVTVVVANNRTYRILKDNTYRLLGGDEDDYAFDAMEFVPEVDFVRNARSHGASARRVEDADALAGDLAAALSEDGPSVVDVVLRED